MRYERLRKLFGNKFETIQNTQLIILGVGGVGGVALDALYRSGITQITIVDNDIFDETNCNRQIGSETGIGKSKVQHLASLYPNVTPINATITPEWIDTFDFFPYTLILDAIDDIPAKVHLISKYHHKLISSGGSAKRINPLLIEYKNIWETYNDPFLRKLRNELKKIKFNKKFKIIFSPENPHCTDLGSFMGVTGSFGLVMSSLAIQKIISNSQIQ